jgi:DNA-binding response OmpR family regulator
MQLEKIYNILKNMESVHKHILWVEDDDELASLFIARMRKDGLLVERAENGEKALAMLEQLHPDLVLVDLMLPKISGYELVKIIRSKAGAAQPKILILSAMGHPDDEQKALELGADDYMVKSQVSIAQIIQTLRRYLDLPSHTNTSAPAHL